MLGAILSWASGLFAPPSANAAEAPTKQKTLWALVEWEDYTENQPIFMKANGSGEIDVTLAAKRDYFNVVGVPVNKWTYSAAKPAEEPNGYRWIPLEAGFGLKLRI